MTFYLVLVSMMCDPMTVTIGTAEFTIVLELWSHIRESIYCP
jgi:hypothetical protein